MVVNGLLALAIVNAVGVVAGLGKIWMSGRLLVVIGKNNFILVDCVMP
jgi:hypothetical protein